VVNLAETKRVINSMQDSIKEYPERGFWYVSLAAFLCAPFLTNDGVCLLMVEPIIRAFESTFTGNKVRGSTLESGDAIYFLLSLACSSNIGSALTYTGNPQNMIVSMDALSVMSPGLFIAYQLVPSIISWLLTTYCILWFWRRDKATGYVKVNSTSNSSQDDMVINGKSRAVVASIRSSYRADSPLPTAITPQSLSPRQRRLRETMLSKVSYIVTSPLPMLAIIILIAMIILIFLNIVAISAVVCMTAVTMVVLIVVGNYHRGLPIFTREDGEELPTTREEHKDALADFFEELFQSIDYSLLLIFLGTFVVVGNLDSTGIPSTIWSKIVGPYPFNTIRSVIGISIYVLISSQLLGNVAVVQMARPNVEPLGDAEKRCAWAVISFVATVGGTYFSPHCEELYIS
jgi:Na+/H+ antiporter NhaD/arsenite permease-like protein